jgi:hypothetical protein
MRPSNVHFFGPLKKHRTGKRFAADSDVKHAVTSLLQTHEANFYYLFYFGIQALVEQWENILNINLNINQHGNLMCIICYSVDMYAFRLKTKFSASECLLAYSFELTGKSSASLYRSTVSFSADLRQIKFETEVTS